MPWLLLPLPCLGRVFYIKLLVVVSLSRSWAWSWLVHVPQCRRASNFRVSRHLRRPLWRRIQTSCGEVGTMQNYWHDGLGFSHKPHKQCNKMCPHCLLQGMLGHGARGPPNVWCHHHPAEGAAGRSPLRGQPNTLHYRCHLRVLYAVVRMMIMQNCFLYTCTFPSPSKTILAHNLPTCRWLRPLQVMEEMITHC